MGRISLFGRTFMRAALLVVLTLASYVVTPAASAQTKDPVIDKTFFGGLAISGYDVVAYFREGKPVPGKEEFTLEHKGAKWQFSSQENLDAFKANPVAYEPQYGGFCAYAVASNDLTSSDPQLWTIYNGKLYLNYNRSVYTQWVANKDDFIQKGDAYWVKLSAR